MTFQVKVVPFSCKQPISKGQSFTLKVKSQSQSQCCRQVGVFSTKNLRCLLQFVRKQSPCKEDFDAIV